MRAVLTLFKTAFSSFKYIYVISLKNETHKKARFNRRFDIVGF
jgi:hypothetical protein